MDPRSIKNTCSARAKSKNWCLRFTPSIPPNPEVAAKIRSEAEYFEANGERMRYRAEQMGHTVDGNENVYTRPHCNGGAQPSTRSNPH
jgi:hypothetical protein